MEYKDLATIIEGFKAKITLNEFNEKYEDLKTILKETSLEKKLKGGYCEQAISEISSLMSLAEYSEASHIKWTGCPKSGEHFDGIIYFNNIQKSRKKIEITSLVEEQSLRQFRKKERYQMQPRSIVDLIKSGSDTSSAERFARENMMGIPYGIEIVEEDFMCKHLIKLLKKKNKDKYNRCWLLIAFVSHSFLKSLLCQDVKNYVFDRIYKEEKELVDSIRNIFEKIIFLPCQDKDKIFEW